MQFKGAVGAKENVGTDTKLQRVLAVEVRQPDGTPVGGDERMDDKVGQAVRVVVVCDRHLGKVPLRGRSGVLAVEESKAEGRQPVIVGRAAPVGDGVGPGAYPAGLAQLVEAVLDAAGARERLPWERLAELEDLDHRQRAAVQGQQDLLIAVGEVPGCGRCCHEWPAKVASAARWYSIFHLHEARNMSLCGCRGPHGPGVDLREHAAHALCRR